MFDFLKDKLKSWLKSSKEKVVEIKPKKAKKEKPSKKPEKKKEEKIEKRKRSKQELEQERKISSKVIEDLKEEEVEIKTPEERFEDEQEQEKEEQVEEKAEKPGFFSKLFSRKHKITEEYFNEIFENLELILLENNVALEVVDYLRESLKKELLNTEVDKKDLEKTIKQALKISIESLFAPTINLLDKIKEKEGTFVIVFFGINGSGKTTTIAKLAHLLKKNKITSILAASDTFRAASIEQLLKHGNNLGIKVIHQTYGSDPAAVAFDAIEYAKSHQIKVVLVDTAGRMYTKENLMKEMGKIIKVTKPDMKIFVAESTVGNDSVEQAKAFNETVGIDGIILSKADVDEKGGTSLSVSKVTGKPILYLGIGQEYDDLELFKKEKLIKALDL